MVWCVQKPGKRESKRSSKRKLKIDITAMQLAFQRWWKFTRDAPIYTLLQNRSQFPKMRKPTKKISQISLYKNPRNFSKVEYWGFGFLEQFSSFATVCAHCAMPPMVKSVCTNVHIIKGKNWFVSSAFSFFASTVILHIWLVFGSKFWGFYFSVFV